MIDVLIDSDLPWDSITVWQVDERVAPAGHAARNSNQLVNLVCKVKLMPVTSRDLRAAARRYASSLPDRFDVIHLGLGDDGHTASWPPGNEDLLRSQRRIELVPEFNRWRRMTLTKRVVNAARTRGVLAVGTSKRTMVERWLLDDARLPISAIRRTGTVVFLDHAAGPAALADSGG